MASHEIVTDSLGVPDNPDPITLEDGTVLDIRQTRTVLMSVLTTLTHEEIAEATGYTTRSGVWTFLNSKRGREARRAALLQHMQDAGELGLRTMMQLARTSRSDTVRQLAAADLMNRAGLKVLPDQGVSTAIQVNINLGD